MTRQTLIPVQDSAGEPYLIHRDNVVRVTKMTRPGKFQIELMVVEPVGACNGRVVGNEVNHYYSELSFETFQGAYA